MNWVVFFSGVLAGELEDDLCAARVFGEEVGYIVDIAVKNDPAAVFGRVLFDCESSALVGCERKASIWSLEALLLTCLLLQ